MKVTKHSKLIEVLKSSPKAEAVITKYFGGMCFGCPMAAMETIEDAAYSHGYTENDLKKIIKELNQAVKKTIKKKTEKPKKKAEKKQAKKKPAKKK